MLLSLTPICGEDAPVFLHGVPPSAAAPSFYIELCKFLQVELRPWEVVGQKQLWTTVHDIGAAALPPFTRGDWVIKDSAGRQCQSQRARDWPQC